MPLFDRRLIFVTGKGGVGKSTVSTALGLVAARRGLRTIVAELSSQRQLQQAFEHEAGLFEEVELAPGLFTISIDPQHAMDEYLRVKTGAVGHLLASSRVFAALAMATPGMRELLSIGKVWELAQLERRTRGAAPYDLVIVDAPATGHGIGVLRTPRTFAEIARVGPVAHQSRTIAATLADREFTALVAVTTAEEMPVNETLFMCDELSSDGLRLDAVIVNSLYPARFDVAEVAQLAGALTEIDGAPARGAIHGALSEHARAETQRVQLSRLQEGLATPLIELPYVFASELGRDELEQLADALAAGLDDLAVACS